jgi:hypothetical protein
VQPGEDQLHLGLNTHRPNDAAPGRLPAHVIKQHSLANTRLTADYQHLALARPHSVDELIQ